MALLSANAACCCSCYCACCQYSTYGQHTKHETCCFCSRYFFLHQSFFFAVAVLGSSSLFTPSVLYSHPLSVSSFSSLLSKYVSAALMVTIAPTTASDSRVAHRQQGKIPILLVYGRKLLLDSVLALSSLSVRFWLLL